MSDNDVHATDTTETEIYHTGTGGIVWDRMIRGIEYDLDRLQVDGDLRQLLGELVTILRLQQERTEELSGEE